MLTLFEQAEVFQAITDIAASDPDQGVQDEADELLELIRSSRNAGLKTRAMTMAQDTSKTTAKRVKALNLLYRLLLKSNVNAS